jgi:4-amino-4-deoxy-L-arabinose transferase-like glycosyltransferase
MFWNKPVVLLLAFFICAAGVILQWPLALLLAVLLVVVALQKLPDAPPLPGIDLRSHFFYVALIVALAGAMLAARLAAQHEFKFNAADTALWLASVLLVIGAAILHDRRLRPHGPRIVTNAERSATQSRVSLLEAGLIVLITLVGLLLRVIDLPNLPPMVHGDEGEVGMLALRVLEGEEALPIFASTIFGQNPAGFPYLMAPLLALFGRNEVGLRLLPALFGAISIPFLYLIGRSGWGSVAGAVAAWLLAVSHFHIHYSRIAVPNIANATVVVVLVWVLFRAYHRNVRFFDQSPASQAGEPGALRTRLGTLRLTVPLAEFVGVGLVIGFGQYIYHGARLLPIIAALAFLFMLLHRKITLVQMLVAGLAALIVIAPLGTFYLTHWVEFIGRFDTVSIFNETNLRHTLGPEATFAKDLWPYLRYQFDTTLSFITGGGDRSSFYLAEIAAFDPVTLILLWLGFGAVLTRIRRYEESLTAAWFLLGIITAGFLTIEQPNGPRVVSVAPACYLIGGIFVYRVWSLLPKFASRRSRWTAIAGLGGLALVLLLLNWRTYFVDLKNYTHSVLATQVARAVAAAPDSAAVYVLGDPILYAGHGTIRFLAGMENTFDLRTAEELPDPAADDAGTWVLALEPMLGVLQAIEEQHPGGERQSYTDARGQFLYATYYLP